LIVHLLQLSLGLGLGDHFYPRHVGLLRLSGKPNATPTTDIRALKTIEFSLGGFYPPHPPKLPFAK
jgi:hypothetical protein